MTYSLDKKDGDKYEIRYWEFLKKDFPNYEVFWARFIVPLTGRAEGRGIGLKDGIDPLLENIAMAHYTVFYHLGVATELRAKFGQEFSEDVLFHLSSSTEMVERLIFILAKLKATLQSAELTGKLTDEIVSKTSSEYLSSKGYSKDFDRFMKRGQAVNMRLHNIEDVTKSFMQNISEQATRDFEKWQDTANKIRHYRNTLAHNPKLGTLLADGENIYVPKEGELCKYELWSEVAKRSSNKDFVLLSNLLSDFQASLIEKTNGLWTYLIAFMDEISKTEGYAKLADTNSKIIFVDDAQPAQPIFPPPSGTHSYDPTKGFLD